MISNNYQPKSQYFSYPVKCDDTIYAVSHQSLFKFYDQKLIRLCALKSAVEFLKISNDGKFLSFVSYEKSSGDLYLYEISTGILQRKTFINDRGMVNIGWHPSGKPIISSSYNKAFRMRGIYAVDENGFLEELFPSASCVDYDLKNHVIIQQFGYGYHMWRNYQGGCAGRLHYGTLNQNTQKYDFRELALPKNNSYKPIFLNDQIFFLNDLSGVANLYKYDLANNSYIQCTYHKDFYIRDFSKKINTITTAFNNEIIYSNGGKIYIYLVDQNTSSEVVIHCNDFTETVDSYHTSPSYNYTSLDINNRGTRISFSSRGRVFSYNVNERAHIQHTTELRHRYTKFITETKILYIKENADNSVIYEYDFNLNIVSRSVEVNFIQIKKILIVNENTIIVSNHLSKVVCIDLKTGSIKMIYDSPIADYYPVHISISPNKNWLLLDIIDVQTELYSVYLCDLVTLKIERITDPAYHSYNSRFSVDGNYIYFLSSRHFKQEYNSYGIKLDMEDYIYAICVNASVPSPLKFWKQNTDRDNATTQWPSVILKEFRTIKIPVEMSLDSVRHKSIYPIANNKILITAEIAYVQDKYDNMLHHIYPKRNLILFDLTTNESTIVASGIQNFTLSDDRKWFALKMHNKIRIGKADTGFDTKEKSYTNGGWCELDNINYEIDPGKEWRDILTNAWWIMRERFYDKKKLDWNAILNKYLSLIDTIRSREDLNYLISEMIGENGTSHNFLIYSGGNKNYNSYNLYCELEWNNGYIIKSINNCYNEDGDLISPLLQPGVGMRAMDKIIAISGLDCTKKKIPIEYWLQNTADSNISLTYIRDNVIFRENIALIPTSSDYSNTKWVKDNMEYVHTKTNKQVGYLHITDMLEEGYIGFKKLYQLEHAKDKLIIDVRYNGGGNLSRFIIAELLMKKLKLSQYGSLYINYPIKSNNGKLVAICNGYTGSDGDEFCEQFRQYKLGSLIGTTTWGGTVGIWNRDYFIDSNYATCPEFPSFLNKKQEGTQIKPHLENIGVEPDIVVKNSIYCNSPAEDAQLNRAIEEALKL